ncbi:DivIVA domain-containing protein [Micromonospora pisi]|uniref:DivIVA domain-containing protein n=1 Tax=Micromonospora pisi TaxID=589240 RepID=A0A495JH08_9ACTN|nr:hypothetical protein [Micromonospora pisi]RKR88173.1 DivIVA domain-containing protein [Micromonospora pisi]
MRSKPSFTVALRGYDTAEVDGLITLVEEAPASADQVRLAAARDEIRRAVLVVRLRGYDRAQVDGHLQTLAIQLG